MTIAECIHFYYNYMYTVNEAVNSMVLILDGNSEHVTHAWRKVGLSEEQTRFVTALVIIKCLKQIK